jgi:hypothetical protein
MAWPKGRKKALPRYCKRGHDYEAPGAFRLVVKKRKNGDIHTARECVACIRFLRWRWMREQRGFIERKILDFDDGSWGAMYRGVPCKNCGHVLRYWKSTKCVKCAREARRSSYSRILDRATATNARAAPGR